MTQLRYFSYCRKSTKRNDRQVQSIQDQQDEIKQLIREKQLCLVGEFQDEMSAKEPNRPGFNEMIERLEQGEADGIICWKLNRLARNSKDGGTIKYLLQRGIIKEIVTPLKTHKSDDHIIAIGVELDMGTQDLIDLSRGVKRGQRGKIKQGYHPGKAPIGYLNDPNGIKGAKKIFRDPDTFPIILHLWKQILDKKYRLQELYNYMQVACPIYRKNKIIPPNTFFAIFRNPFYYGVFKWGGTYHLGNHPPMISKDEFDRAQVILGNNSEIRFYGYDFPYKGLVRCASCNGAITGEKHSKWVKRDQVERSYNYYRCTRKKHRCKEKPVNEMKMEQEIDRIVSEVRFTPEFLQIIAQLLRVRDFQSQQSEPLANYKQEISATKRRISELEDLITEEKDARIRDLMKDKLNKLEIQLRDLRLRDQKQSERQNRPYLELEKGLRLSQRLSQEFNHLPFPQKRDLLMAIGLNWRLKDRKVHCDFIFGLEALKMTQHFHRRIQPRFELMQTFTGSARKARQERVDSVWSYLQWVITNYESSKSESTGQNKNTTIELIQSQSVKKRLKSS